MAIKDDAVSFRVTPELKAMLERLAKDRKMSTGKLLRILIVKEAAGV